MNEYQKSVKHAEKAIKEAGINSPLLMYPNPAIDELNLQATEALRIEVYTMLGQYLQGHRLNANSSIKIQLNGPSGLYFLKCIRWNGQTECYRIVKVRE